MNYLLQLLVFLLLVITVYSDSEDDDDYENNTKYTDYGFDFGFPEEVEESENKHRRIIMGKIAKPGQFPWQITVIYRRPNHTSICGGSLISSRWILTAAHCAHRATFLSLRLGAVYRSGYEGGIIKLDTSKYIVHEDYNVRNLNHDIALIDLERSIRKNDYIKEIQLPSKGDVLPANETVEVSGWGHTNDKGEEPSLRLKYVTLQTITNEKCAQTFGSSLVINSTVCTIGKPYESTCTGDSGSGLVVRKPNGDATLVGIVSYVAKAGCEKGYPAAFVRTEPYLDWISKHTGIRV